MRRRRPGRDFFIRRGYGVGGLALDLDEPLEDTSEARIPSPTFAPLDVRPGGPISGDDFDGQPSHLTLDINDRMPSHEGAADAGDGEAEPFPPPARAGVGRAVARPGAQVAGRELPVHGDIVGNNPIPDFMPHLEPSEQHWPEGGLWQDEGTSVEDVPVDRIIGGQEYVIDTNFPGAMKGLQKGQLPFLVEQPDGRFLILDGHHRITQQMLNGADTVQARVYRGPTQRAAEYGGGPFALPDDHKAGMDVPPGGASCAKCKYLDVRADGPHCISDGFVTWNGSTRLPTDDPETYCSDWFVAGGAAGFEQGAEVGNDLEMLDSGEGDTALSDTHGWNQAYAGDDYAEGGGSTIHLGALTPEQLAAYEREWQEPRSDERTLQEVEDNLRFQGPEPDLEAIQKRLRQRMLLDEPEVAPDPDEPREGDDLLRLLWGDEFYEEVKASERERRRQQLERWQQWKDRQPRVAARRTAAHVWVGPDGAEHPAKYGHQRWMVEEGPAAGMPPEVAEEARGAGSGAAYAWMGHHGWMRLTTGPGQAALNVGHIGPDNLARIKAVLQRAYKAGADRNLYVALMADVMGGAGEAIRVPVTPTGRLDWTALDQAAKGQRQARWAQMQTAPARPPWLAVDLDGTLLSHEPGAAQRGQFGKPLSGAAQAMRELKSLGWKISVFTARLGDGPDAEQVASQVAQVLEGYGIPFDDVWIGRKPRADFFVDDKAIPFKGNWAEVLRALTEVGADGGDEGGQDWHVEDSAGQAAAVVMDQHAMPGYMDNDSGEFDDQGYTRNNVSVQRPPDREAWF